MPHLQFNRAVGRPRQSMEDPYASGNENQRRNRNRIFRDILERQRRQNNARYVRAGRQSHFGGMGGPLFPHIPRYGPGFNSFGRHHFPQFDSRNQRRVNILDDFARRAVRQRFAENMRRHGRWTQPPAFNYPSRGYPPWPHSQPTSWPSWGDEDDFSDDEDWSNQAHVSPSYASTNRFTTPSDDTWYPRHYNDDDDYNGDEFYSDDDFEDDDEDDDEDDNDYDDPTSSYYTDSTRFSYRTDPSNYNRWDSRYY